MTSEQLAPLLQKWLLRSRKGPDIFVTGDQVTGLGLDIILRWQKEFQADFCASCCHQTVGPADPGGDQPACSRHWTDIVGVCWNFRERESGQSIGELVAASQEAA